MLGIKTITAQQLRKLGLEQVVENPRLRRAFGVPIYKKNNSVARPVSQTSSTVSSKAVATPQPADLSVKSKVQKQTKPTGPLVSVVIPIYNIEGYLADCIDSVIHQSYSNLRIILVDDGSTDSSLKIAQGYASANTNVTLIEQENQGLGAARNTGIKVAKGKYICFVDSDDILPHNSIELLVESLETSGSFFAMGAVERFNSTKTWTPAWVKETHNTTRQGITGDEHPPVLYNVFAWNKLFRLDRWNELVGEFPVGVLYEDQEVTARLFAGGIKFDVLSDTVYKWRLRDDGSSITQNKTDLFDLEQRILVAKNVEKIIQNSDNKKLIDYWYTKLLSEDLYYYYREIPRANEEFGKYLQESVQHFSKSVTPEALQKMPYVRRLMYLALAESSLQDFEKVLLHSLTYTDSYTTTIDESGDLIASSPIETDLSLSISNNQRIILAEDLKPEFYVVSQNVNPDRTFSLQALLFIKNLDVDSAIASHVFLEEKFTGSTISLQTSLTEIPEVAPYSPDSFIDSSLRLVDIHFNHETISELIKISETVRRSKLDKNGKPEQAIFTLKTYFNLGKTLSARCDALFRNWNGFRTLKAHQSPDASNTIIFDTQKSLSLKTEQVEFLSDNLSIRNGHIKGSVKLVIPHNKSLIYPFLPFLNPHKLQVSLRRNGKIVQSTELITSSKNNWKFSLKLPSDNPVSNENVVDYSFTIEDSNGKIFDLFCQESEKEYTQEGLFALISDLSSHLHLEKYNQFATIGSVELVDNFSVKLTGFFYFDMTLVRQPTPSFALVNTTAGNIYPETESYNRENNTFAVTFNLTKPDSYGHPIRIDQGTYIFQALQPTGKKLPASIWPRVSLNHPVDIVKTFYSEYGRLITEATPGANGLRVKIASPFNLNESGKRAQYLLHEKYMTGKVTDFDNAVLFECFEGKTISDSCLAIDKIIAQQRPDLKRIWTVKDMTVAVPDGAIAVTRYSEDWWKALSTSKYLVNNNNFPVSFKKSEGQIYLQTWHGTPLKKIGFDMPLTNLSVMYQKTITQEISSWDFLLAQSHWAGEILANAFTYKGQVLADGYPRNDALFGEAAEQARTRTRNYLGIDEDTTVLLYAPTWRENVKAANGNYENIQYLDFNKVHEKFGDKVLVLMRGHANTILSGTKAHGTNVLDVSTYPDINDLMNASDLLVGDYSSVMFDYVNTGKPMIFLMPDLQEYRDELRGFYFEFEDVAPGRICNTTSEVNHEIENLMQGTWEYKENYKKFKQQFAPHDREGVAETIVGKVFLS